MSNRQKHTMEFKPYPDLTTTQPTTLVAHKLTRADLDRYDDTRGCFRLQRIRFQYAGIQPKAGDFLVRYEDSERFQADAGIVTLVGAARFYQMVGDQRSLDNLGKLVGVVCE